MTETINTGDRIRLTKPNETHEFIVFSAAGDWVDSEYNSFKLSDFAVEILERKRVTTKEFFDGLEIGAQFATADDMYRFAKTGDTAVVRLASRDKTLKYYPNVFEPGAFSHWTDNLNNFVTA